MYKNILITGSNGFIGRYLTRHICERPSTNVFGVDKNPHDLIAHESFTFLQHDLTERITNLSFNPECIVHLASDVGGVVYNNNDTLEQYNKKIDQNLVFFIKQLEIEPHLIFMSSINVFEGAKTFNEGLRAGRPVTQYAISKQSSEAYFAENISNLSIIRPTNVFGANQSKTHRKYGESHVIPDLLNKIQFANNGIIKVLGDGTQRRNFLHVTDLAALLEKVINTPSNGHKIYNVRSDLTISITELVDILIKQAGAMLNVEYEPQFMSYEHMNIYNFPMSSSQDLNWEPSIKTISQGLMH